MFQELPDFRTTTVLPPIEQAPSDCVETTASNGQTAQQPTGSADPERFMRLSEFMPVEPASSQNGNGNGEAAVAATPEVPAEETVAATGWLARAREGLHQGLRTGKEWVAKRRAGIAYTVGVAALYGAGHYGNETLNELDVSPSLGGVLKGSIGVMGSEHVFHTGVFATLTGAAFLTGLIMRHKSPKAGRTSPNNASLSEPTDPGEQNPWTSEHRSFEAYMEYCDNLIDQSKTELEDLQRSVEESMPKEFKTIPSPGSMPERPRLNVLSVVDEDFIVAAEEMLQKEDRIPESAQNGYEPRHAVPIPA